LPTNLTSPFHPGSSQLNYYGGDLQGIIDKLPYLKGLGVNVLYLTPIFQAGTNHGYDTADYMKLATHLGSLKIFKALIVAAHKVHMKVILDGVFNHTSSDSTYFNQYGTFKTVGAYQSQSSPYYGWYTFQQWPSRFSIYSDYRGPVSTMPELNESDAVKSFIYRDSNSVAQYWLKQGADGWRLDHAVGKSDAWWQEFRTVIKGRFPNDALICECDLSSFAGIPNLLGSMFDGDMSYLFRAVVLSFYAHGQETPAALGALQGVALTATQFLDAMVDYDASIPQPALYGSMNVIGSHDTDRALNMVKGSVPEMEQLAAFQMAAPGTPEIYYGDEAGLTGSGSPDTVRRKPFPWSHPNKTLQAFYSRVIHLRLNTPAVRDGSIIPLLANDNERVVAFVRKDARQTVPVIINDGAVARNVSISVPGIKKGTTLVDGISGKSYRVTGATLTVRVAATSTVILVPVVH
jgi:glycosidase